ncbi:hypothetical protein DACRYDRAFT_117407 [Dacryopinax primogenitus]|uniref:Uncharacterized protein n=1 Tax=Dacryopinax primogenitus (strain DJM 731) TaxID=1858805 RepID=M5G3L5_DACPD|nr:uncharacterized protein DACRYDRAFT_117407 [Dacryopinax primogenitus]EJU00452.1 hypothetical protein DACRYDRAFT_117407 [Dacryopinax primogenitus]
MRTVSVALVLSTTSPPIGTDIPRLEPQRIGVPTRLYKPVMLPNGGGVKKRKTARACGGPYLKEEGRYWRVGPEAPTQWIAEPRLSSSAFLQCQMTNSSSYILLSGPSNVFLDGPSVAKSTIPHVSPSDTFPCSVGVDPFLRITYPAVQQVSHTVDGQIPRPDEARRDPVYPAHRH